MHEFLAGASPLLLLFLLSCGKITPTAVRSEAGYQPDFLDSAAAFFSPVQSLSRQYCHRSSAAGLPGASLIAKAK